MKAWAGWWNGGASLWRLGVVSEVGGEAFHVCVCILGCAGRVTIADSIQCNLVNLPFWSLESAQVSVPKLPQAMVAIDR